MGERRSDSGNTSALQNAKILDPENDRVAEEEIKASLTETTSINRYLAITAVYQALQMQHNEQKSRRKPEPNTNPNINESMADTHVAAPQPHPTKAQLSLRPYHPLLRLKKEQESSGKTFLTPTLCELAHQVVYFMSSRCSVCASDDFFEKQWILACRCNEDAGASIEWDWCDLSIQRNYEVFESGKSVIFHPLKSQGTAIVRGTKLLTEGLHYWELKVLSPLYGTDVMVGIGTDGVDLYRYPDRFVSALGMDSQSWGFSYRGETQHNREVRCIHGGAQSALHISA
ncbi:SPRY domain-containing SOCS box protein 3 [Sparganum proliferum]